VFVFNHSKKRKEAQRFLARIINNQCSLLDKMRDGPRDEPRVNLALVLLVVPIRGRRLDTERAFAAVTREVSTSGLSLATHVSCDADEVVLGIRYDGETRFLRAQVRHEEPLAVGLYQVGVLVAGALRGDDYPELLAVQQLLDVAAAEPV
jgi:hypothetical protein